MKKIIVAGLALLALASCSVTRATPAPVVNATAPKATTPNPTDTTNTAATASTNNMTSGTTINKVSSDENAPMVNTTTTPQKPYLTKKKAASATISSTAPTSTTVITSSASLGSTPWLTPTQGKIVSPYSTATKGVDIEGHEGQAIIAAATGKVAYSGSGLKGYGNLIIIKHSDNYLTAYSHNKINLVKEGDIIKRGQKIAELGKTDSDRPILHFEIRKNGKPLDPTSIFSKTAD